MPWAAIGVADERILVDYALVVVVALVPLWLFLFRLLRLRDFQPRTRPMAWGREQSRTPVWAMQIVRITQCYRRVFRESRRT